MELRLTSLTVTIIFPSRIAFEFRPHRVTGSILHYGNSDACRFQAFKTIYLISPKPST